MADITDKRRPLPGVVVNLSGERLADKKLQTVSDDEGRYNFTGLTAGDYALSVELQGFKKYEQKTIVQIEATVELNILLQPIALSETVTVTEDKTDAGKTESTTAGRDHQHNAARRTAYRSEIPGRPAAAARRRAWAGRYPQY